MTKVKVRIYTDVHGNERKLTFEREVPYLVPWLRYRDPSVATQWKLEDGSTVQVPDKIWAEYDIKFKDETFEE